MKTYVVIVILSPIPYFAKLWLLSYGSNCCRSIKLQDFLKSQERSERESLFLSCIWTSKFFFLILSSFWVCKVRYLQSSQNKKFAYLRNISGKTWAVKLCFCLQINTNVFYKLIVSLWACVSRHAESMKTNIFARSL